MSDIPGLVEELLRKARESYNDLGVPYDEEGIRNYLETFNDMPEEGDFSGLVESTGTTRTQLSYNGLAGGSASDPLGDSVNANAALGGVEAVADELDEWRGDAASSFRDNVKIPFRFAVPNMFIAACVIHGAATAQQAVWREANKNVKEILENAINAIDSLDDCNPDEFTAMVTVIASIVSIPVTGGATGFAVALAGVKAANDIAKNGKTFSTGGGEAMNILWNTKDALDQVITEVNDGEKKVKTALEGVTGWMTDSPQQYQLGGRPTLADHPGGITGMK